MFEKRGSTITATPVEVLHNPERFKGPNSYIKPINLKTAAKEATTIKNGDDLKFDLEAEVRENPDFLYIKCFAIKANETNDNGDWFSSEELKKAYQTFVGVPCFVNHQNNDIEKARGKVIHAWYDDEKDGIMIISRIDAVAYPSLARGIKTKIITGCFPPDAKVLMCDGTERRICDVEPGDEVISGKGNIREVLAKRIKYHKDNLLSINVEGIREPLVLTKYHNVITYKIQDICLCGCNERLPILKNKSTSCIVFNRKFKNGHNRRDHLEKFNHIQKKVASDLSKGDILLEPKFQSSLSQELLKNKEEAFLVGLFLAEGSYEKRKGVRHSIIFNFGASELETIADDCYKMLSKVFAKHRNKPTILWQPKRSQTRVCLYGKDIAEWFYLRCGEYSNQKKLHESFLHCDNELTTAILAGYIEGDGYNVKGRTYGLTTASRDLANQFRVLFTKIGIRICYRVRKKAKTQWGDKDAYEISFGLTTANKLRDSLIWKKADKSIVKAALWHSVDKYNLRRIKSIKEISYNGLVYDLEIEEDHTYCVNHLAMSNTSMGCQVQYSLCSVCHNQASRPVDYCSCIKEQKHKKMSGTFECQYHVHGDADECPLCGCKKGEKKLNKLEEVEVHEKNYDLKFIEDSLVVSPACHGCGITEVIDTSEFIKKVAEIEASLPGLLKAASTQPAVCSDQSCMTLISEEDVKVFQTALEHIQKVAERIKEIDDAQLLIEKSEKIAERMESLEKFAGERELNDLNTALTLISDVSKKMIDERQNVDLEYVSDLTDILAKLQETAGELESMGYGKLPDTTQAQPGEQPDETAIPEGTESLPPQGSLGGMPAAGGSKVQTGPATGGIGSVTSPTASIKLPFIKKAKKTINFPIKLAKNKGLNLKKTV